MTCRELIGFLDDYVAGGLAPPARQVFEQHLDRCPHCRDYLRSYRQTIELVQGLRTADEPPPAEVPRELIDAVRAARTPVQPGRRPR